jgi:hypothetical protein
MSARKRFVDIRSVFFFQKIEMIKSKEEFVPQWYHNVDWAYIGYLFFMLGSVLYFIEALGPYATCCKGNNDDGFATNSTINGTAYYSYDDNYYSEYLDEHPLVRGHTDGWLGFIASLVFNVESSLYIFGWTLGRYQMERNGETMHAWYKDWNCWGNWLFFVGSIGYNFTDFSYLLSEYDSNITDRKQYRQSNNIIYLLLGINFVFDSVFYFFAALGGETSRAPTHTSSQNSSFQSKIDWYLFATLTFIAGSGLYVWEAVQQLQGSDAGVSNMIASALFIVDAGLYIASAFHDRQDQDREVHVFERKVFFIIEHHKRPLAESPGVTPTTLPEKRSKTAMNPIHLRKEENDFSSEFSRLPTDSPTDNTVNNHVYSKMTA